MKRIVILLFAVSVVFSAYSQNYLQNGDRCFDNGDYTSAITNYTDAFKTASGKDKQIADLKLNKAKNCLSWLKNANQAFNSKNYTSAKIEYQKVLDSNPNDTYVKSQLEKCNTSPNPQPQPALRKATTAELTDIWNNKYGVLPERRQNLVNAGIDPYDAQIRINKGEGKPATLAEQKGATLTVSPENITFIASGGITIIDVKTNAKDFKITYLPSWCRVESKYSNWFSLACDANNGAQRNSFIKVSADDKEKWIYINQSGNVSAQTKTKTKSINKRNKCFNCPTAKYSWGLTIGYVSKIIDYNSIDYYDYYGKMDGIQVGLRFEPLFKYGFGLNMGLNYEYYSKSYEYNSDYEYGDYYTSYDYQEHVLNIPFHLEYRLNLSKYFNIFAYGGFGLDVITDSSFSNFNTNTLLEYGGGLRIDHIQFNVGKSNWLNSSNGSQGFPGIKYKDWILSMSYMF